MSWSCYYFQDVSNEGSLLHVKVLLYIEMQDGLPILSEIDMNPGSMYVVVNFALLMISFYARPFIVK